MPSGIGHPKRAGSTALIGDVSRELIELAPPFRLRGHERRVKRAQRVDAQREQLLDQQRGLPRIDRRRLVAGGDERAIGGHECADHQHERRGEDRGKESDACS